jgi:Alkylmercury lyase
VLRVGPDQPPGQGSVVHIPCEARRWWDDVVATCSNIRLFCDPSHVGAWARSGSHAVGQVIPSVTMWRLAQTWYGNRLDPDWSPRHKLVSVRRDKQVLLRTLDGAVHVLAQGCSICEQEALR